MGQSLRQLHGRVSFVVVSFFNGKCRTESVIYCAEVKDASYIGMTSGQVKDRITSHRQTFREEDRQNSTTLSKFIWTNRLNKDETGNIIEPPVKWSILQQCETYKPGQKYCNLCLTEKLFIISNINKPNNINKRTDVATICIHKQKHFLNSVTWSPRGCVLIQPFTHTRGLENISRLIGLPATKHVPHLSLWQRLATTGQKPPVRPR